MTLVYSKNMATVKLEVKGEEFRTDSLLLQKLDTVKKIREKDWDCVFIIDGKERSGKSTLAQICGWYLTNGKLTLDNIAIDSADAVKKLEVLPDKSVLIIDEGSLSFSSKDVMKKENRRLQKILQVIGQKSMTLIIVLPSFFELSKYTAVERSRFLLHCYTAPNLGRGRFAYFGEKKKHQLYILGKKNYSSYAKPRSSFVGEFKDFNPFGKEYLELKRKTLMSTLKGDVNSTEPVKETDFVTKYLVKFRENTDITIEKLSKGFGMSTREVYRRLRAHREREGVNMA